MSQLNKKVAKKIGEQQVAAIQVDLSQKRDDECAPMARRIFERLAARSGTLLMGNTFTHDELSAYYKKAFMEDVSPLMVEFNLKVTEYEYVFGMMMQVIEFLKSETTATLEMYVNGANARKWGQKDVDDLRLLQVTNFLATGEEPPFSKQYRGTQTEEVAVDNQAVDTGKK